MIVHHDEPVLDGGGDRECTGGHGGGGEGGGEDGSREDSGGSPAQITKPPPVPEPPDRHPIAVPAVRLTPAASTALFVFQYCVEP